MLCGEAVDELVSLLTRRQASLWHACNFQDFRTYLLLGGVPSRASLEQSNLPFTAFATDGADHANGVWDKVFLNLSDFGEAFARGSHAVPNAYGPIVLQISPAALREATDVAVCLRSAGARDFDRELEALPSVELVDTLFCSPVDDEFPYSAKIRYGQDLLSIFPQAKSSSPEVSCTVPAGRLSLYHVIAIWTDPYVIANKSLQSWVQQSLEWLGIKLLVNERSCSDGERRRMYQELAEFVKQGCRSLTRIEQSDLTSNRIRDWALGTFRNGIDYNFQRYADYFLNGTLCPLTTEAIPIMPAPKGTYADKFTRLMALKRMALPEAIGEIVAALEDENENIRWLAGSTLQAMNPDQATAALQTVVQHTKSTDGRHAAEYWLTRIGEAE